MDYCIPRLRLHLASGAEKKEAPLSKTEKQLQILLSKVSNATILGECINIAIAKGTKTHLRKIISELKDQLRDVPDVLESVIGKKAIELLKKL